jgi:hypothetical protein
VNEENATGTHEQSTWGVGPYSGDPAKDPNYSKFDPELLANGDTRNVVDVYRYWSMEAIVADLDTKRHGYHVAIENWQHDLNIGSIVRTANAFMAKEVHIIGNRRWSPTATSTSPTAQMLRALLSGQRPQVQPVASFQSSRSTTFRAASRSRMSSYQKSVYSYSARKVRAYPRQPLMVQTWFWRLCSSVPQDQSMHLQQLQ